MLASGMMANNTTAVPGTLQCRGDVIGHISTTETTSHLPEASVTPARCPPSHLAQAGRQRVTVFVIAVTAQSAWLRSDYQRQTGVVDSGDLQCNDNKAIRRGPGTEGKRQDVIKAESEGKGFTVSDDKGTVINGESVCCTTITAGCSIMY